MKNYAIGLLVVGLLFASSVIYRQENTMVYHHFPLPKDLKKDTNKASFFLFLFFSKNDCMPCVVEIAEVLKTLPEHFRTAGIVTDEKFLNEAEIRHLSGVKFPLYGYRDFKKYLPWRTPTLIGVSSTGKTVLLLPGMQGQQYYLEEIVLATYGKLYSSPKALL